MRLETKGLSCGYGRKTVVEDISMSVEGGEVLCLLGANGSGKTTFFKTILGLLEKQAGQVLVDGRDVEGWSPARRARLIGYVPQARGAVFPFRALDVVLMGRTSHLALFASPSEGDVEKAEAAMAMLDISYLKDQVYTRISGGEQQLVLLARALAQEPRILILDEPTTNLDFGRQFLVMERVKSLSRRGLTVILSTHFPEQSFFYADRVLCFRQGRPLGFGSPSEVVTRETIRAMYGIDVRIISLDVRQGGLKLCIPDSLVGCVQKRVS